jgi:predicted GIY-YIG superfamily endonuclease
MADDDVVVVIATSEEKEEDQRIKRVVEEEIASLPEKFKQKKKEYICYCLRSTVARARTYFGTTHDLVHRLRQHNGIIKGGAVATKTSRPWRIGAVVHGFSDRSAALRYEWYCKIKHSKQAITRGANAIQRRAAVMARAKKMCPNEKLEFHYNDEYIEQCCQSAFD